MPRDESRDVGVIPDADECHPWAIATSEGFGMSPEKLIRYVPHSHLPPPCSTCRHRIVNSERAMYCTKIFRDTPDDGFCYLHDLPKEPPDAL